MGRGSALAACLAASSAGAASGQAGPWDAALRLFSPATIAKYNARCLDGSPPGLFFRPATSPSSATKFKLHIQGGGWATTPASAAARAGTVLGSSATWPPWLSAFWPPEGAGFAGLASPNDTTTGDWNFAWLAYCDGSSHTSDADAPVDVNGTAVWLRGRAILDGHLAELDAAAAFLTAATEVVVSGTSAGGLAAYLHTGYIKSRLPANARVVAVPDAGFFRDHAAWGTNGTHAWYDAVAAAMGPGFWNATLRGGAGECLAALAPAGVGARCFFPEYLYPFLTDVDGIFVLQSTFDTANLGICYGLSCNLAAGQCTPAESAAIAAYAADLLSNMTAAQAPFAARDGLFATSCFQHEESCRAADWFGITIDGATPASTFAAWYGGAGRAASVRVDAPWPADRSCQPQGFTHGAC
jgi:hypothetical protein